MHDFAYCILLLFYVSDVNILSYKFSWHAAREELANENNGVSDLLIYIVYDFLLQKQQKSLLGICSVNNQ